MSGMFLPLQVPGAMELAVIVLIFLKLGIPVVAFVALVWLCRRRSADEENDESTRVEELGSRVAELEGELESRQTSGSE